MKVLTVRQPWAWAIVHGGKDVENRSRNLAGSYRGPVAIHAALKEDRDAMYALPMRAPNGIPRIFRYGVILGVVDLTGVHTSDACWEDDVQRLAKMFREDKEAFEHLPDNGAGGVIGKIRPCSDWADVDAGWHLELSNPRPLKSPIPFKGALGLRDLPADVEVLVEAQP